MTYPTRALVLSVVVLFASCFAACSSPAVTDVDSSAPSDAAMPDATMQDATMPDAGPLADGAACTLGTECASTHCVDGVCCASACTGLCLACSALRTGAADGVCAAVAAGTDPDTECAATPASGCGVAGLGCNGDEAAPGCVLFDATTECAPETCTGGASTAASSCDGMGTCVAPAPIPCAPYACGTDGACLTSCGTGADCAAGTYCASGACVPTLPQGSSCTSDEMCATAHCADQVCCGAACTGGCDVCSMALGASADGTCTLAPRGATPATCGGDQLCDGTSSTCQVACADASTGLLRRPVDFVFVVDNSSSMTAEITSIQSVIANDFAALLDAAGLDYRIILVSRYGSATAAQSICVAAPLSAATTCTPPAPTPSNGPRFFHYSVEIGSSNAWCQVLSTFSVVDEFNHAPTGWQAWLRPEAFKQFVVITDDNLSCTGGGTTFAAATTVSGAQTVAANLRTAILTLSPTQFGTSTDPSFRINAIVGMVANTPVTRGSTPTDPIGTGACSTASQSGLTHQAAAVLTGGMRYPICQTASYDAYFQDLATRSILTDCRYAVPAAPLGETVDPSTLTTELVSSTGTMRLPRVTSAAACTGAGFYLQGNDIALCPTSCGDAAGPGVTVRARYLCL